MIQLKKKRIYNSISHSDDSTSSLDNNYAILQHNKGMIAVKSDEEEDIQEEDTQEEDKKKEEDKKNIPGEELKTEEYPW